MKIKYNALYYRPNETDYIIYDGETLKKVVADDNAVFAVKCMFEPYIVILTNGGAWYIQIDDHDDGDNRRIDCGTNGDTAIQKFFDLCNRSHRCY